MQLGNFIDVFLARHVAARVARHHPHRTHDLRSGSQDHHLSKKKKLGVENHMLQLNI